MPNMQNPGLFQAIGGHVSGVAGGVIADGWASTVE
jgi:hypothetical protein